MSGKWFLGTQPEYDGEYQYADHFVGGPTGRDIYSGEILTVIEAPVQDNPPDGPVRMDKEVVTVAEVDCEQDAQRIIACVNYCEGVEATTLANLPPLADLVSMWQRLRQINAVWQKPKSE